MMRTFGLSMAALLGLAACDTTQSSTSSPSAAVAPLGVNFSWDGTARCFDSRSPAFTISGAPAETASLKFKMTDLDATGFNHGGGTVSYSGPSVPSGAFSYKGPCPPTGSHNYRWTVTALDAGGSTLGRGSATLPFSQSGR